MSSKEVIGPGSTSAVLHAANSNSPTAIKLAMGFCTVCLHVDHPFPDERRTDEATHRPSTRPRPSAGPSMLQPYALWQRRDARTESRLSAETPRPYRHICATQDDQLGRPYCPAQGLCATSDLTAAPIRETEFRVREAASLIAGGWRLLGLEVSHPLSPGYSDRLTGTGMGTTGRRWETA